MFDNRFHLSYAELARFMEQIITTRSDQPRLSLDELNYYNSCLRDDKLLQGLLKEFPLFEKKWESFVNFREIEEHERLLETGDRNVHNFNHSKRTIAREWLNTKYSHSYSRQELNNLCANIFKKVASDIAEGRYDATLQYQERERSIEKARNLAKKNNRAFKIENVPPGKDISLIQKDFQEYIESLIKDIPYQTFVLNELACLYQWIQEESIKDPVLPWTILVEILDEGRTGRFLDSSINGKDYSCLQGLEERLLDRVYLILYSIREQKDVRDHDNQLPYHLIDNLFSVFLSKDPDTDAIIPSNFLYQCYLAAQGYNEESQEVEQWQLKVTESVLEQKLENYQQIKLKEIKEIFNSYQNQENMNKKNEQKIFLTQYADDRNIESLLDDESIKEKISENFFRNIRVISENLDYPEIFPKEWAFFKNLFEQKKVEVKTLIHDENPNDHRSPAQRLADLIGFGIEHVKILAAIIEPQKVAQFSENNDIIYLKNYAQLGALRLDEYKKTMDFTTWRQQAHSLYEEYLKNIQQNKTFVTFLPPDHQKAKIVKKYFFPQDNSYRIPLYFPFRRENEQLKLVYSFGLLAELVMSGQISLDNTHEKLYVYSCAKKLGYEEVVKKITKETWPLLRNTSIINAVNDYRNIDNFLASLINEGDSEAVELVLANGVDPVKDELFYAVCNKKNPLMLDVLLRNTDKSWLLVDLMDHCYKNKFFEMMDVLFAHAHINSARKYFSRGLNKYYDGRDGVNLSYNIPNSSRAFILTPTELENAVRENNFKAVLFHVGSDGVGTAAALEEAVISHKPAFVNLLLLSGAPLPTKRKGQENLLMTAAYHGDTLIIKHLLPFMRESVFERNKRGQTALDIAKEQGHHEIVEALEVEMLKMSNKDKKPNIYQSVWASIFPSSTPSKKQKPH